MQSFLQDNKKIKSPCQQVLTEIKDDQILGINISKDIAIIPTEVTKPDSKQEEKLSIERASQILSGVIIEQNDNDEFLSKLTNDQDEEEEDEDD